MIMHLVDDILLLLCNTGHLLLARIGRLSATPTPLEIAGIIWYETCRTSADHSSRLPGNKSQSRTKQGTRLSPWVDRISDLVTCHILGDHVLAEPLKYQDIANLSQGKPHCDMSSLKLN